MEDYVQVEKVYVLRNCSKNNYFAGNEIELKGYQNYRLSFVNRVSNFFENFFSKKKNLEDKLVD